MTHRLRVAIAGVLFVAAATNRPLVRVTVPEGGHDRLFGAREAETDSDRFLAWLADGPPYDGRLRRAGRTVLLLLGLAVVVMALVRRPGPSVLRAMAAALAADALIAFRAAIGGTHVFATLAHLVFAATGAVLLSEGIAWVAGRVSSPA